MRKNLIIFVLALLLVVAICLWANSFWPAGAGIVAYIFGTGKRNSGDSKKVPGNEEAIREIGDDLRANGQEIKRGQKELRQGIDDAKGTVDRIAESGNGLASAGIEAGSLAEAIRRGLANSDKE